MTFTKGHPYGLRFGAGQKSNGKKFEKGSIPWNKGIAHSDEVKQKISNSLHGNKNRWLGNKAKIKAIHMYIYKIYGLATKCDKCGDKNAKKYEWSNISRTYSRDMSDWWQLCINCHRKYDHPRNR